VCHYGTPLQGERIKNIEEATNNQLDQIFESIEQQTITFYGKPLIVVRLPDSSPAVVLNHLCENLGLERTAQFRRIQRKKALASGLYSVRIETSGGSQIVQVLNLRVVSGWLFGIETSKRGIDQQDPGETTSHLVYFF
jgi:hypothetical protein